MSEQPPSIYDFFDKVRKKVHTFGTPNPREAQAPKPEEVLANQMRSLAHNGEVNSLLLPFLERVEKKALKLADETHSNHAETSYWLGYSASLRSLRECFDAWRDNRLPAPQKGPLNE